MGLAKIEGAQQVVAAPVVGTQGDYLLIGIFGVLPVAESLVSATQADVGVFIGGFEFDRALELLCRFFILTGAALEHSQANMAGGAGIAEVNGFGTSLARFCDEVLILAGGVFLPVGCAQVGFCSAVARIDLERLLEQDDRAIHIGGFAGVLEIATRLSVVIVGIGHAGAVESEFASFVGFQRKSEGGGDGLGDIILDGERIGDG